MAERSAAEQQFLARHPPAPGRSHTWQLFLLGVLHCAVLAAAPYENQKRGLHQLGQDEPEARC